MDQEGEADHHQGGAERSPQGSHEEGLGVGRRQEGAAEAEAEQGQGQGSGARRLGVGPEAEAEKAERHHRRQQRGDVVAEGLAGVGQTELQGLGAALHLESAGLSDLRAWPPGEGADVLDRDPPDALNHVSHLEAGAGGRALREDHRHFVVPVAEVARIGRIGQIEQAQGSDQDRDRGQDDEQLQVARALRHLSPPWVDM